MITPPQVPLPLSLQSSFHSPPGLSLLILSALMYVYIHMYVVFHVQWRVRVPSVRPIRAPIPKSGKARRACCETIQIWTCNRKASWP